MPDTQVNRAPLTDMLFFEVRAVPRMCHSPSPTMAISRGFYYHRQPTGQDDSPYSTVDGYT